MNAIASSVRGAIVQSYLERRQPLPAWIAHPVIWHLGLLRRMQAEQQMLITQQKIARSMSKNRRRKDGTRR